MRRIISIFVCVSILLSATFSSIPNFAFAYEASNDIQGEFVEGQALVKFKEELTTVQGGLKLSSIDDFDYTVIKTWNFNRNSQNVTSENSLTMALVKSDSLSTSELISNFEKQANVDYATPNSIYHISSSEYTPPNDYNKSIQWGLDTISVESVWSKGVTGSDDLVIAVLDSGVDYNHEDLKDNMWVRPSELSDVLEGHEYGCNFLYDDPQDPIYYLGYKDANPMDDNGHGTHCAGILGAAGNNGKGITGVNQNTKIMALKIADMYGNTYAAAAITAYDYMLKAKENGVNLVAVSNSWSMPGKLDDSEPLYEAIKALGEKGVLSVCAAGNSGVNNDASPQLPCGADLPYVISVAAIGKSGSLSGSNYGRTTVDVAAPGISIYSTIKGKNSYMNMSGTSMATPFITGSVALLRAYSDKNKLNWSPEEIKARIVGGTIKNNSLKNKVLSDGYFNLGVAIDETKIMPVLNDATYNATDKTVTIDGYFFGNSQGQLKFKDKNLTIQEWSNNKITAALTDSISSSSSYSFTVLNSDGQRSGRNDLSLKVIAPLSTDTGANTTVPKNDSGTEANTSVPKNDSGTEANTTANTSVPKNDSGTEANTTANTSVPKNDSGTEANTMANTSVPKNDSGTEANTMANTSVPKNDSGTEANTTANTTVPKNDSGTEASKQTTIAPNSGFVKEDTDENSSMKENTDKNGFIKEGTDKNGFDVWYYYENGIKVSGWCEIEGYAYYFNPDNGNALQTGWLKTSTGDYYYFDVNINGKSNRISTPSEGLGRVHTGWINDGGKEFYYLDAKSQSFSSGRGKMLVGWFTDGGSEWYYGNTDKSNTLYGKMETGWKLVGQEWYYLDDGKNNVSNFGKMHRGWSLINGSWYYFYNNGNMAHDTYINEWYVDENGRWI